MLLDSNAPQNIYDCDEFWLCDKKIEFSIPFWDSVFDALTVCGMIMRRPWICFGQICEDDMELVLM